MPRISATRGGWLRAATSACPFLLGVVILASTAAAGPRTTLAVGVILPAQDPALHGARLGAAEAERSAQLFGATFTLHEARAQSPSDVSSAAARMIGDHGVTVLIGGADAAAASALIDVAEARDVVFLNIGAPDDSLRARCSPLAFHVLPSESMLRDAAAALGIPHAAPAAWHNALTRYGAGQVNARFRAMFERPIGERAWAGWFAVKAVWEAALRGSADAHTLARQLAADGTVFDGHKGVPLSFRRGTHQLRQPIYLIAGDSVVAETPSPRDSPELDHAVLLDRIGVSPGGESCPK